jgi:short-subunit dehydrogenase
MRILILGATSKIAEETARCLAAGGAELYLAARTQTKLDAVAADLEARGAKKVERACLDLNDTARHAGLIADAEQKLGGLDAALIAHGTLGDQKDCEADFAAAERELVTNFTGPVSLLTLLANRFEQAGKGTIAVITSVAGDRGRQSNYVYGAAKGGLAIFLAGLRNRLAKKGVRVVTIKPGFVDTPMTAGIKKNALFASPQVVGARIAKIITGGAGDVVYVPWFWRYIMCIIRSIPEPIFKKLKL